MAGIKALPDKVNHQELIIKARYGSVVVGAYTPAGVIPSTQYPTMLQ